METAECLTDEATVTQVSATDSGDLDDSNNVAEAAYSGSVFAGGATFAQLMRTRLV